MTSVISFVFVASALMYFFLVLAFILKNYPLGMLSGMGIFCIGIYIAIYNIEHINDLLTQSFAVISIWLGLYILIKGSKEKIEELM